MGEWKLLGTYEEFADEDARFVVDADIDRRTVFQWLQGTGASAVELPPELRHSRAHRADPSVLAFAKKTERFLITHDEDFLDYREHPPEANPGVIVIPGGEGTAEYFLPDVAVVLHHVMLQPLRWRGTYVHVHRDETITVYSAEEHYDEVGATYLRINDDRELEFWDDE